MPAATADQAAWFASMDNAEASIFPGNDVDWSVLQEMEKYRPYRVTSPTCPISRQDISDYGAFYTKLQNSPGLNLKAELLKLQATLQADYDCSGCIQSF